MGASLKNGEERRLHGFGPGKTPNGRGLAAGADAREI